MGVSRTKALAVFAGASAALLLPAGAASAAAGTDCPPSGEGAGYPGASCTAAVSDTTVVPGEDVTVSGSDFEPGTTYTIVFHSRSRLLARGTTDSSTITDTVSIPTNAKPGDHTLVLRGTDDDGGPRVLRTAITVVGEANTSAPQTAGLPGTGADSTLLPLAGAGAGVVLAGAGLVAYSRRRRQTAPRAD